MGEEDKGTRTVQIELGPFDSSEAEDFYGNLTGVGCTQHDVVLVFGRAFPGMQLMPDKEKYQVRPSVRISMSHLAAGILHKQLGEELEKYRLHVEKAGR